MAEDALLEKIGKIIETKLEAEREQTRKVIREETEPLKQDVSILKNGQAQNTTLVEAVLAGQEELQKTIARETTVMSVAKKLTDIIGKSYISRLYPSLPLI